MLKYELVAEGTDVDNSNDYYVYLRRDRDDRYYDTADGVFRLFQDLIDGKIELTEDANQPGLWKLSLSLVSGVHGSFTVLPRDANTDVLIEDGVTRVQLDQGVPTVDQTKDKRLLNTHYGGIEALQLLNDDGDPIEGASIRVYTKAEYDDGDLNVPIGVTVTDYRGYWIDAIPVNLYNTYVVHFFKPNEYGPVSTEVTVG